MGADLLDLIDLIYEAAVDFDAWRVAIVRIGDALRARQTSFEIYDPASRKPPFVLMPNTDPDDLRAYAEHWVAYNSMRDRAVKLPAGAVLRFEDLMPREEFDRTPIYNEFWRRQGIDHVLSVNIAREGTAASGMAFSRTRRDGGFEREDLRLLGALAPHLRRAVALNLRLARLDMQRTSTAEMLDRCPDGALLVDAQAHILLANAAAEKMLGEKIGLRVINGCLAAASPAKTTALHRLIAGGGAGGGELIVLPGRDGAKLTACVLPVRAETAWLATAPAAIVFVKATQQGLPSAAQLQQLFDLTGAQANLAREILRGDGIPAVARRLGVSSATARSHLLEVFQKTGTTRQAELVRVILQRSLPEPRGGS